MSTAYVPYAGTAGWSGTDTSKARALDNLYSGNEQTNQENTLEMLKVYRQGLTWRELAELAKIHHGSASGVLSVLHKKGAIIRSNVVRNRCKVYYHPDNAANVVAELHGRKPKPCPHCGNDINA